MSWSVGVTPLVTTGWLTTGPGVSVRALGEVERGRRAPAGALRVVQRPEHAAARDPLHVDVPRPEARLGERGALGLAPVDPVRRAADVDHGARRIAAGAARVDREHPPVVGGPSDDAGRDDLMVRRVKHRDRIRPGDPVPRPHQVDRVLGGHLPVVEPQLAGLGQQHHVGIGEVALRRLHDGIGRALGQRPGAAAGGLEEGRVLERGVAVRIRRDREMIRPGEEPGRRRDEVRMHHLVGAVVGREVERNDLVERHLVGAFRDRREHGGLESRQHRLRAPLALAGAELPAGPRLAVAVGLAVGGQQPLVAVGLPLDADAGRRTAVGVEHGDGDRLGQQRAHGRDLPVAFRNAHFGRRARTLVATRVRRRREQRDTGDDPGWNEMHAHSPVRKSE